MKKFNFFQTVLSKILDFFFGKIMEVKFKNAMETILIKGFYGDEYSTQKHIELMGNELAKINGMLTPERVEHINDPKLIPSSDGRFHVRIEHSGKDHLTLHTSKPIISEEGGGNFFNIEFPKKIGTATGPCPEQFNQLIDKLYATGGCEGITFRPFSVLIKKSPAVKWDDLRPEFMVEVFDILEKKYPAVKKEELTA